VNIEIVQTNTVGSIGMKTDEIQTNKSDIFPALVNNVAYVTKIQFHP